MTSDEERREVAKRLRGLDATITNRDTLEQAVDKFMKAVCGDIPFSPIRYSVRNLCGLAGILADLIDRPTCRMTKKGPEFVLAGWWECSECGPVYPPCNDEIAVWALQKCPRCGAKVVE